jgi:hypothetical protein
MFAVTTYRFPCLAFHGFVSWKVTKVALTRVREIGRQDSRVNRPEKFKEPLQHKHIGPTVGQTDLRDP